MTTIDKIRAEIERLKKYAEESKKDWINEGYNQNAFAEDCRISSFDKLLAFLDSLEEPASNAMKEFDENIVKTSKTWEPVTDCNDFDAEIKKFFDEYIEVYELPIYGNVPECLIKASDYEMIAYHFYQFGLNSKQPPTD